MAHICTKNGKCKGCPYFRYDEDYGNNDCWYQIDHKGRSKLRDDEYNAILHLTSRTKLDSDFDVVDLGDTDGFIDRDTEEVVAIRTGLLWLYDGLAYPLAHDGLNDQEAHLITQLFLEFKICNQSEIQYLLMKEEN